MELLFLPLQALSILIIMPYVAFVPAAVFVALWHWKKSRISLITAILWALYGLYELGMYLRILCSGECNIRVDLLAIYPLLLGFSLATVTIIIVQTHCASTLCNTLKHHVTCGIRRNP